MAYSKPMQAIQKKVLPYTVIMIIMIILINIIIIIGEDFMGRSVSAVEARQKLGELLSRVALRQEEIIIERAGKKIARLSPIGNESPKPKGKLDFRKAAGLGKEIWKEIDVDAYLRQERDQWV